MKFPILAFAFCLFLPAFVLCQSGEINIIPKPASVENVSDAFGTFELNHKTPLYLNKDTDDPAFADIFNTFLRSHYNFALKPRSAKAGKQVGVFLSGKVRNYTFPIGGYELLIERDQILILASDNSGRFNALQSLFQILPTNGNTFKIPAVHIKDAPRFPYRGMHLDVGRHFMPVSFVKKYIDLMSQYKFNYFHWHLTEDQGWRIEIKKYPKLTEIGSKRKETVKEKNLQPYIGDGIPVEGFYTQEEIKDVVAYAKARYITVIPEIELPGHSSAALAAYPELGCKQDYQYKVQTTWGIFKEVYCPTEKTFQFLEDVLTEVIGLFPDSPYIHIGGDEVLKDQWKESPEVKELMEKEGLKDEHEVQSYFIRRMEKFINSKGKKIIGWDEILEGGLAPNATVMSWRGVKGGIAAAKEHHDVIMTPTDFCYFDYGQGDPATEPINIGGYLPLEKVYSFDPVPKELTADEAEYIIGGQGNVWTEYLKTPQAVEYMAFPRMMALSEVLWSRPEYKNFADFTRRLSSQYARLDRQGVNYRIPEPLGLTDTVIPKGEAIGTTMRSPIPGARVLGTVDGSDPTENSSAFPEKFIANPQEKKLIVKTITILPTGRKSSIYTTTYLSGESLKPTELAEKRPGVTYGFASPTVISGETKSVGLQQFAKSADLKKPFAVAFDGYFNAPFDGIYEFQAESAWNTKVFVSGEQLINTTGDATRNVSSELIALRAGLHKISLHYDHRGGEPFWRVRWAIKGQNWRNIGGGELVH